MCTHVLHNINTCYIKACTCSPTNKLHYNPILMAQNIADGGELDNVLMDKLHRLSRPQVALSDDDVFDGVLQQLRDSMVFMFGDDFDLTRVKRQIRKIEAEYGRFVRFINKPGVRYDKATNVVSIIRSYSARSSRRVSVICECYVLILLNAYSIDPCFNTNSQET